MMRCARGSLMWLLMLAGVAASGCSQADSTPPVATVLLSLSKKSVAVGGVLDLTYRFQVAPGAKVSGDYRVFVHVLREDGTRIWADDHELPAALSTSRWQPGQIVEYTRTRFIPKLSYLGTATIEIGLYKDDDRLPLTGPDPADRESSARSYTVASLELLPQSQNLQVLYLSGWHPLEFSPEDPTVDWQWTQKVATLSLKNPKRDVTFFLEWDTRPDAFGDKPQVVRIYCGGAVVATFQAGRSVQEIRRIPVTALQLGAGEMAEFRIEVDRTFVPARQSNSSDVRELGIRVHHVYVEASR